MGNKNNKKKSVFEPPKFELDIHFKSDSSVFYSYELLDGRLFVCLCGLYFEVYKLNNLHEAKKDLKFNPGIYTVSSTLVSNGNIVICTYGKDMKVISIEGNEVKDIQTITANGPREEFAFELSNKQLLTVNFYSRGKLFSLIKGLYEEIKTPKGLFIPIPSKMKEIKENILIIKEFRNGNNIFLYKLMTDELKNIKTNSVDFEILNKNNIMLFNKKNIEILDIDTFKINFKLAFPNNINIKIGCLYNQRIIIVCTDKGEVIEFQINENKLIEIDRIKVKLQFECGKQIITKLKNGSLLIIDNCDIYIYKPILKKK